MTSGLIARKDLAKWTMDKTWNSFCGETGPRQEGVSSPPRSTSPVGDSDYDVRVTYRLSEDGKSVGNFPRPYLGVFDDERLAYPLKKC